MPPTAAFTDHAAVRAATRYGLHLNDDRVEAIFALIDGGRALLQGMQRLNRTSWTLELDGQRLVALVDREQRQLISLLPLGVKERMRYSEPSRVIPRPQDDDDDAPTPRSRRASRAADPTPGRRPWKPHKPCKREPRHNERSRW